MQNKHVIIRIAANCNLLACPLVLDYGELAEKHLVDPEAAVVPGVEIQQHLLVRFELRSAEDDGPALSNLSPCFFDHNTPLGDLSFQDFLYSNGCISVDVMVLVESTPHRKDFPSYDGPGSDEHIVVERSNNCSRKCGLRDPQQAN
jgi:hypothetical protein